MVAFTVMLSDGDEVVEVWVDSVGDWEVTVCELTVEFSENVEDHAELVLVYEPLSVRV
jgi:hypothetical protein